MSNIQQWQKDAYYPQNQLAVVFDDAVNMPEMRPVYCSAAGNVSATDKNGTTVVYAVLAGQFLPIMPVRINATGTTVGAGTVTQVW